MSWTAFLNQWYPPALCRPRPCRDETPPKQALPTDAYPPLTTAEANVDYYDPDFPSGALPLSYFTMKWRGYRDSNPESLA